MKAGKRRPHKRLIVGNQNYFSAFKPHVTNKGGLQKWKTGDNTPSPNVGLSFPAFSHKKCKSMVGQ